MAVPDTTPNPMLAYTIRRDMTLTEAGPIWLETKRPYVCDRTLKDYGENLKRLKEFFGSTHLDEITADSIRTYQLLRRQKGGPGCVNKETNSLGQILDRVGLWKAIEPEYKPFPMPLESKGRALTEEEEYRLFTIGALNPNWEICYNVALLSAHTACGPGEIRHLKLSDVFLAEGDYTRAWIKIREESAKNRFRIRTVPLDKQAHQAVTRLLDLAKQHGAHAQEHYLLPKRIWKGRYDPTKCATSFKTAWVEMCAAAGLDGLRMYDLRHHALTRLAEKVPQQVVLKIAGHVSERMLRKVYAHVRDTAVRDAIDCLSRDDGWKPTAKTVTLLTPKSVTQAKAFATRKQAERIVKDGDTNDWLRLMGEE